MKAELLNRKITDNTNIAGKKKKAEERFEYLILRLFLTAFTILIAVQAALLSPFRGIVLSEKYSDNYFEGELLKKEAYFFVPVKMELKLTNIETCPELMVLVNGTERESFNKSTVLLELKDGDVVELDASMVLTKANVQVSTFGESGARIPLNAMSVTDGITLVAKVKTSR